MALVIAAVDIEISLFAFLRRQPSEGLQKARFGDASDAPARFPNKKVTGEGFNPNKLVESNPELHVLFLGVFAAIQVLINFAVDSLTAQKSRWIFQFPNFMASQRVTLSRGGLNPI